MLNSAHQNEAPQRLFSDADPLARCVFCGRPRPLELLNTWMCARCKKRPLKELLGVGLGDEERESVSDLVRGTFIMRGYGPGEINTYDCKDCKAADKPHTVDSQPYGVTSASSCWGVGIPTTIRVCSACGRADGPWVSADIVGDGW